MDNSTSGSNQNQIENIRRQKLLKSKQRQEQIKKKINIRSTNQSYETNEKLNDKNLNDRELNNTLRKKANEKQSEHNTNDYLSTRSTKKELEKLISAPKNTSEFLFENYDEKIKTSLNNISIGDSVSK